MAEEVKGKEQEWNSKRESRKVGANQEKWESLNEALSAEAIVMTTEDLILNIEEKY